MKNALLFSLTNLVSKVVVAFCSLALAKMLTTETYGLFGKIVAISSLLALIFSFGIPEYTAVNYSRKRISYSEAFLTLNIIPIPLSLLVLLFSKNIVMSIAILKAYIEINVLSLAIYYSITKNEYRLASFLSLIRGIAFFISLIILKIITNSLLVLFISAVIIDIMGIVFFIKKEFCLLFPIKIKIPNFSEILPFSLTPMLGYFYTQGILIILSMMVSDKTMGNFLLAYSVVLLTLTASNALYQYFLPKLNDGKKYYKDYLIANIIVSIVLFLIMEIIGFPLLKIIYGSKYSFARELNVLIYILLIQPFSYFLAAILTSRGFQHIRVYVLTITNILFMMVSYFLVKNFGSMGAAYASLIASALTLIFYTLAVGLIYKKGVKL